MSYDLSSLAHIGTESRSREFSAGSHPCHSVVISFKKYMQLHTLQVEIKKSRDQITGKSIRGMFVVINIKTRGDTFF